MPKILTVLMIITQQDLYVVRKLHALAIRAKENELPKIENKLVKKIAKKIPINSN